MRYFSYNAWGEETADGDDTVTLSEEDIRKEYYPYWYEKMCNKFGKEHVDKQYSFEDCLYDWRIVNWAWEVDG